jgi:predicted AAA+ superfamily ATPase
MSYNIQKYRFLQGFLPKTTRNQLVLVTGARQAGKTTLAKLAYPNIKYFNLDSPENREVVRAVLSSNWGRDIGNAVIDEVQKEPVVFEKIKYAYDERDISFTVMLGSSQILLLKKIRESLSGRVSIHELWPLLMKEVYDNSQNENLPFPLIDKLLDKDNFESIFSDIPGFLVDKEDSFCRDVENYFLQWGGMPALLPLSEKERWQWLKDYEYTYLERDLADLARIDDLEPFRKFQKLSALRSGMLLNYSEIARDASVSVDTARRYLEYLRLSYQVILLQPYYKNITSSVIKTPKIYWLDVGLLRQLTGFKGEITGNIYETMVVAELIKWIKTAQRDADVYFYRTRSGLELDILLGTQSGIVGIEIKSRETIVSSDCSALKEVAKGLEQEWRGGLIVYRGNEIKKVSEPNIWAVPSRRLFL